MDEKLIKMCDDKKCKQAELGLYNFNCFQCGCRAQAEKDRKAVMKLKNIYGHGIYSEDGRLVVFKQKVLSTLKAAEIKE